MNRAHIKCCFTRISVHVFGVGVLWRKLFSFVEEALGISFDDSTDLTGWAFDFVACVADALSGFASLTKWAVYFSTGIIHAFTIDADFPRSTLDAGTW